LSTLNPAFLVYQLTQVLPLISIDETDNDLRPQLLSTDSKLQTYIISISNCF